MWTNLKKVFCVATLLCAVLSTASGQNTNGKVTDAGQPFVGKTNAVFDFQGGSLGVFIYKVRERFGIDLDEIATIPEKMRRLTIPKMRIVTADFETVLSLYNSVSHNDEDRLGKWAITKVSSRNGTQEIAAIQLISGPSEQAKGVRIATEAVSLVISDEDWSSLLTPMNEAEASVKRISPETLMYGNVRMNRDAHIVVITGSPAFVESVSSIIRAYKDGQAEKNAKQEKPPKGSPAQPKKP